jgi:transcription elongation factor B subunit 2
MHLRVKRQRTTVFLHVDPTDTSSDVKVKLQALLQQVGQSKSFHST